jgi:membrane protease YdiL (CAAX protease family)
MSPASATAADLRGVIGIAIASAGMVTFAWCSHQGLPWGAVAAGGLMLTASAIGSSQSGADGPAAALGLQDFSRTATGFTILGVLVGIGGGLLHRGSLGLPLRPVEGVQSFVVVACLIGATEELIYRGWMFGRARALGWPAAVVIAAVAHAAYKTALFAWPSVPSPVDLTVIAFGTVAGGIVLGLLRVFSRSLIPPVLAHVAFDFVVYRSVAHAPWWVWG